MRSERSFGCEFEFSSGWDEVESAVRGILPVDRLYVAHRYHRSVNNTRWHLKTDSSTGAELVTPVSNLTQMGHICKVIDKMGCMKLTKDDGFHVHVSTKGTDLRALVALWARAERAIMPIFSRNRQHNTFCAKIAPFGSKRSFSEVYAAATDHHAAFSISRQEEQGTAEFRVCEGTADPLMIKAWIRFCVGFVDYVAKADPVDIVAGYPEQISLAELLGLIGLDKRSSDFLLARA